MSNETETEQATFSVSKGNPTPEELAAVVAVMSALAAGQDRKPHAPGVGTVAGGWKSYWRTVRSPLHPGQEAWRTTFRA